MTSKPSLQHQERPAPHSRREDSHGRHISGSGYTQKTGPHQNTVSSRQMPKTNKPSLQGDWREWTLGEEDDNYEAFDIPVPEYPLGNRTRRPVPKPLAWGSDTLDPGLHSDHEPRARTSRRGSAAGSAAATHVGDEPAVIDPHAARRSALRKILGRTEDPSTGWDAYQELMSLPPFGTRLPVPWEYLHRLVRLIAAVRPRTRTLFLRLLAVVTTVHNTGGRVDLWEWNVLIDFAGKGFRRTPLESYRDSYDTYQDLVNDQPPGTTFNQHRGRSQEVEQDGEQDASVGMSKLPELMSKPDVYTLTTLLNIATKTRDAPTLTRVWNLFKEYDIPPNRVTYLTLLMYYAELKDVSSVRRIIHTVRVEKMDWGVDGLNQLIWAFMRFELPATAEAIYKLLRHNYTANLDHVELHRVRRYLAGQHIMIPSNLIPDPITYMSVLQSHAYNGRFQPALQVFLDMNSHLAQDDNYALTEHSLMGYRAFFIGFYRFGSIPPPEQRIEGPYRYSAFHVQDPSSAWTFDALQTMFDSYMALEGDFKPSNRLAYWILMAFARTTGNNLDVLRATYDRIRARFGVYWDGRLRELHETLNRERRGV
ncbi:hypothetical protein EIP86_005660 [Pleurotus ostreatoroseus]|nr:hypothetical protein EIP86_005660 [Pleurotus ostreatoroseus]